jgi:F-type H+-transporting ATPase subunit alpha
VLDYISKEDPKIKGEAEEKVKAAVESFAKDFA